MKLIRPGMGTENALEVIAALIKIVRPSLCLEIGAGDSSTAIAGALSKAQEEHRKDLEFLESDRWSERGELLIPAHAKKVYEPKFISIDNFSAEGCSASEAWAQLDGCSAQGVAIQKINCDFHELPGSFYEENRNFDFIWIDAGTLVDDVQFIGKLWSLLAEGGLLCLHEPYFTATVKDSRGEQLAMIRTPLWEYIVKSNPYAVDILSLPECHKYRQSGLGILRKRLGWEAHRNAPFQEEMLAVGQAPIRFSVTGLFSESDREKILSKSNLKLLKNDDARSVLYAIGLGASSVEHVKGRTNLDEKIVLKMLAKLLSAKIIQYKDGLYSEYPSFWKNLNPDENSNMYHEMDDARLENPNVLDLIVDYLSPHREYSEAYISRYCSYFTHDFARLRRKLVDDGRLLKTGNTYRVRQGITSRTQANPGKV